MFAIEVHERVEREAVEIDGESNEEMYIYIERERAKEGGLTRHHPQTIKYQLGSCLPAKFISVHGASLLIIRWPISFRNEHPPMPDAIAPRKFKTAAFTVSLPRNCRLPPSSPSSPASSFPPLFTCVDKN